MGRRETITIPRFRDQRIEATAARDTHDLAPGARLGRYVVLYQLGEGGMGAVYAAYDPQLDRKIAIKLLHSGGKPGDLRPDLDREARALARLSHPNVVTVHDLGSVDGRAFVAMELLEGCTLGEWLTAAERSWQEVLRVFLAAGQGLAAAHALGVVHQDFKPTNVMVSPGGEVRVLDFGLARVERGDGAITTEVWGTPAYLAPERLRGCEADARGDQYSFCAALHEALWRRLPHRDGSGLRRPGTKAAGPSWLWPAVARGLARDPEARHPSMESLLAELDLDRRIGRRRAWSTAAALAVMGFFVLGYAALRPARAKICAGGAERVAEVWSEPHREAVRRAFRATEVPAAEAAFERARQRLDGYTAAWETAYTKACRATHVLGEQSERLLDQRMQCLGAQLAEVGALAEIFQQADREVVLGAAEATYGLEDPARCEGTASLAQLSDLPADPTLRRLLELATERLAEQRALDAAGRPIDEVALEEVVASARELAFPPLEARALRLLADWRLSNAPAGENLPGGSTEEALERAFLAAVTAGDRRTATLAAIDNVRLYAYEQNRPEEARFWRGYAEASLSGLGSGHEEIEASLERELGGWAVSEERWGDAQTHYRRALKLAERAWGRGDPRLVPYLTNLGLTGGEEWEALFDRALGLIESSYGSWSPHLCGVLVARAGNYGHEGRYREAAALAERCLRSLELAHGAGHRNAVYPLLVLGQAQVAADRPAIAMAALERALDLVRESFDETHPLQVEVRQALADAALLELDVAAARAHLESAHAIYRRHAPADASDSIKGLLGRARLARLEGDRSSARTLETELEGHLAKPEDLPKLPRLHVLLVVAEGHLDDGRPGRARPLLEMALGIERPPADAHLLAQVRLALARALADEVPARALELARTAEPALAAGSAWTRRRHRQLTAWLAARRPELEARDGGDES